MEIRSDQSWTIGAELKFIEGLGTHSEVGKRMGRQRCLLAYRNVLEEHHPNQDSPDFKEVMQHLNECISPLKKGGRPERPHLNRQQTTE